MSTTVENHVVRMTMDNKDFERNADKTIDSIQKLKDSMKFEGAGEGIDRLAQSVKNVDTSGIAKGVDEASKRFSALEVFGVTAMVRISNAAIDLGKKLIGAINAPLKQIKSGGWSRALNIEQASFKLRTMGMDVAAVMENVKEAVSGTAFGLDEAASAAAVLSASGIKAGKELGQLESVLLSISNTATITNSEFSDIADIYATVASNGKLMTMQLRQLSARGVNASQVLAKELGKTEAEINDMVTKGQISFETFSNAFVNQFQGAAKLANESFTGVIKNIKSALSRIGEVFAEPIIKNAIPMLGKLRTLVSDTAVEFKNLFGSIDGIGPFEAIVKTVMEATGAFIEQSDTLEGFKMVAHGLFAVFETFVEIAGTVAKAWRNVFPPKDNNIVYRFGEAFKNAAEMIRDFTVAIMPHLQPVLEALFGVIKAIWEVIRGIAHLVGPLLPILGNIVTVVARLASGFFQMIANVLKSIDGAAVAQTVWWALGNVIEFVVGVIYLLVYGLSKLNDKIPIFTFLGNVIGAVVTGISRLIGLIKELINTPIDRWGEIFSNLWEGIKRGIDSLREIKIIGPIISSVEKALQNLGPIGTRIKDVLVGLATSIRDFFASFVDSIRNGGLSGALDFIKERISGWVQLFKDIFSTIVSKSSGPVKSFTGILGGLIQKLKDFASTLDADKIAVLGFIGAVVAMITGVTRSIFAFSDMMSKISGVAYNISQFLKPLKVKQDIPFLAIAKGIALIAGSLALLTLVDPQRLKEVATALGIFLAALTAASVIMALLGRMDQTMIGLRAFSLNLMALAGSVALIGIAIASIALALKDAEWHQVEKGLQIFAGAMIGLMLAVIAINRLGGDRATIGIFQLLGLALSLRIILGAFNDLLPQIKELDQVSQEAMNAFMILTSSLLVLTPALKAIGGIIQGIGVAALGIAAAIYILARVVTYIRDQNWDLKTVWPAFAFVLAGLIMFTASGAILLKHAGKDGKGLKRLASTFIAMTVAIGALALLVGLIGMLPTNMLIKGGVVIAAIMAFVTAIVALNQVIPKGGSSSIKHLTLLVASLVGLLVVLIVLTRVPIDEVIPYVIALGGLLIALVAAFTIMNKIGSSAANIATMVSIFGSLIALGTLIIIFHNLGIDWKTIASTGLAMAAAMGGFTLAIRTISKFGMAGASLKNVAIVFGALLALAGMLYLMQEKNIHWDTIIATGLAMSAVMVAFGGAVKLISGFRFNAKSFSSLSLIFGALLEVSIIMWAFEKQEVNWDTIIATGLAMSAVMVAFGGAIKLISGFKFNAKSIKSLGLIFAALLEVAVIMWAFEKQEVSWDTIIATGIGLSLALVAFGGAIKLISGFKLTSANAKTLITVLSSLIIVGFLMGALASSVDWKSLLPTGLAMSAVFLAFGGAVKLISGFKLDVKNLITMGVAMGIMVGVIVALALVSKMYDTVSWKSLIKGSASLIVVAGTLAVLSKIVGKDWVSALTAVGGMAGMAVSLIIIAEAIKRFEGIDWESMAKAGVALGAFALALGLLSRKGGVDVVITAAGFVIMAAALIGLAAGLKMFAELDFSTILIGVGAIAALALVIGLLATFTGQGIGALAIAAALIIIAAAIVIMADGLAALKTSLGGGFDVLGMLAGLGAGIIVLGLGGVVAMLGAAGVHAMGDALVPMAMGLMALVKPYQMVGGFSSMLAGLGVGLLAISLAGAIAGPSDGEAIAAIGLGLIPLSLGLTALIAPYHAFGGFSEMLAGLGVGIAGLSLGAAVAGPSDGEAITALGDGLIRLSAGLLPFIYLDANILNTISSGIRAIAQVGNQIDPEIFVLFTELSNGLGQLSIALLPFSSLNLMVLEDLARGIVALGMAGVTAVTGAAGLQQVAAVLPVLGMALAMFSNVFSTALGTLVAEFEIFTLKMPVLARQFVNSFRDEFLNASRALIPLFYETYVEIGKQPERGFRDGANWHSPIKFLMEFFADFEGSFEDLDPSKVAGIMQQYTEQGVTVPVIGELSNCLSQSDSLLSQIFANMKMGEQLIGEAAKRQEFVNKIYDRQLAGMTESEDKWISRRAGIRRRLIESYEEENGKMLTVADSHKNLVSAMKYTQQQTVLNAKVNEDLIKIYGREIDETLGLNDASKELIETSDDLGGALSDPENMRGAGGGVAQKAEEATDALMEFQDAVRQAVESGIDLFKKFEKKTDLSGKELLDNMRSQVQGVGEWANNLQVLAHRGISQGLLEELALMGPRGYEEVHAFTTMTNEELMLANELFAQSLMLPDAVASILGDSWMLAGNNMNRGIVEGLNATQGEVLAAIQSGNAAALGQHQSDWGWHSPSTVMIGLGRDIMLGMLTGLRSFTPYILNFIAQLDSQMTAAFTAAGEHAVQGLISGIDSQLPALRSKIEELCEIIASIPEVNLDMHSPSRLFMRYGQWIDEGLAIGIERNSKKPKNAVAELVLGTKTAFESAMETIGDFVSNNNPIITPILDLSQVYEDAKYLDTMFEDPRVTTTRSMRVRAEEDRFNADANKGSVVNNFTQNNYSPKALSRLDIYRQTRRQLQSLSNY